MLHEFHEFEGRRWPVLASYGLAASVVALAIVFSIREAYRATSHNSTQPLTPVKTLQTSKKQPPNIPAAKAVANSPSSNQLPNNGPGNTLALFIGSALLAGSLHYVLRRHRDA